MKRDATIYGLFDASGACHYVGCTVHRKHRMDTHALNHPELTFKTIRRVSRARRFAAEKAEIARFKLKDQAGLNQWGQFNSRLTVGIRLTRRQAIWIKRVAKRTGRTHSNILRILLGAAIDGDLQHSLIPVRPPRIVRRPRALSTPPQRRAA